jgi:lipopolysaccharide export system protein LptC
MSELAERERLVKRRWAVPGSTHDRVVGLLKIILPAAIGIVLAYLALAPLERGQEISFLLDKNKVDVASERMRLQTAQYRGQDGVGRPFVLNARSAVQATSAEPIVRISDMDATIQLDDGPARIEAGRARYDLETNQVDVLGPILFTAPDGYRLETRDVLVDLHDRTLASRGPVEGRMPLGRFTAGRMEADLPDRRVVLSGRARLHIVQGVLR